MHFVRTDTNNTLFEIDVSYREENGYQYIEPSFSLYVTEYSEYILYNDSYLLPQFIKEVDYISEIDDIWWETKNGKEKYGGRVDEFIESILRPFCEKWKLNYITD